MNGYVCVTASDEVEAEEWAEDNGYTVETPAVHHEKAEDPEEQDTFVFRSSEPIDYPDAESLSFYFIDLDLPDGPVVIIP